MLSAQINLIYHSINKCLIKRSGHIRPTFLVLCFNRECMWSCWEFRFLTRNLHIWGVWMRAATNNACISGALVCDQLHIHVRFHSAVNYRLHLWGIGARFQNASDSLGPTCCCCLHGEDLKLEQNCCACDPMNPTGKAILIWKVAGAFIRNYYFSVESLRLLINISLC